VQAAAHTLESLEARARAFVAPIALVEVREATSGYDADLGRPRAALAVSVVLAAPGDEDSRYRVEYLAHLDAGDPGLEIARRLADRLGVPLYPDSPAMQAAVAPRWLAQQGPSPERAWPMAWRTTVWRPDGTTADAEQAHTVLAASGREAHRRAYVELSRGLAPPFAYTVTALDIGRPSTSYHQAGPPAGAPSKDTLRVWALDGRPLAAVLRGMTVEAPSLTPLDVMVALEHAFLVDLCELGPAGAFCRGVLGDAELEAALGSVVAARKPRWSLPHALLLAHTQGESIGPVLHRSYRDVGGVIPLIVGMRDAFGLSLMAAKAMVDTACDGRHDRELDAMLDRAVRAIAAGGRDDYHAMFGEPSAGSER
jgi:hypothetical protein